MFQGVDHVVILVEDLDTGIKQFQAISGNTPEINDGPGFKTARFRMGAGDIVLGQPTTDQGPVARHLATNGEGVYIVAVKVDDQQQTLTLLREAGIRLVGDPGPGHTPTGPVFVHPSAANGVLTQLVQA